MENSRRPEVSFFILILLFGSAVIFVAPSAYALPPPNSTSTSISCSFYTQVSPNYFGCAVTLDDTTCGCTAPNGWIALSASGSGTFVVFDPPPDHVGTNCFDYGSQCGFTYTPAPGSASSQTITATYAGCIYTTSSTDCSYPGFTGSSSSIVVTATANTALAVSVGAPDAAVVGTPATFIAEASGGMPPFSSFTWTAPGGNPSTGTGSIFSTTFNAENTYTITAAVNDSAGGSATGFASIAAVLSITGEVRCSIGILGDGLCLPIGTVQSQRGTSTVVDGTTGAQRSGTGMYLGDIIQTGDNSVVGLCPSSASCTPSLLRFDQDQDTTIGGLAAFVGTANPANVQIRPNTPTIVSFLQAAKDTIGWEKTGYSISRALSVDMAKRIVTPKLVPGLLATESAGFAVDFIAGASLGVVGAAGVHILTTQVFEFTKAFKEWPLGECTATQDAMVLNRGSDPEFTITVGQNGTTVQVFSGTVSVQSLNTTQITPVSANQQVFIPRDPSRANTQVMNQSVTTFNPQKASRWWDANNNPNWLNSVIQALSDYRFVGAAVIVTLVVSISLVILKRRPKKTC